MSILDYDMLMNRFLLFFLLYFTNSMNAYSFTESPPAFVPDQWPQFVLKSPPEKRTFFDCSKEWSFDSCDRLYCLKTVKLNKSIAFLKILTHDLNICQNKEVLHSVKDILGKWFFSKSVSDWDNNEASLDVQNLTPENELQQVRQALGGKSMDESTSQKCLELSTSTCIIAYCLSVAKLNRSEEYPQMLRDFAVTCNQDKVLARKLLVKVKQWEEGEISSSWDEEGPSLLAIERMIQSRYQSQSDMKVCVPGFVDDRDRGLESFMEFSKSSVGKELLEGTYHNIPGIQPSTLLLGLIRDKPSHLRIYNDCTNAQFNSQKDLSLCLIATRMNKSYSYFILLKKLRDNCVNRGSQICQGLGYKLGSWQLGNKSPLYGWDQFGEPEHISSREDISIRPPMTFSARAKEYLYLMWVLFRS